MVVLLRLIRGEEIIVTDWIATGFWAILLVVACSFIYRYYLRSAEQQALLTAADTQSRYNESLARIASAAVSEMPLESFLESSVRDVVLTLNGDIGNLVSIANDDGHDPALTVEASVGVAPYPVGHVWRPGMEGMAGLALLLNKGVMSADILGDNRFKVHPEFRARKITSGICSLVPNLQGKRWGIVSVLTTRPRWFAETDMVYLNTAAQIVGHTIERKRTEMRYKLLADSEQEIVFTKDPAGQVTYVSPSVERVIGYSADELFAQPKGFLRTVVHPDDAHLVADICTDPSRVYHIMARLHCRVHQAYRWFDIHIEPVTNGLFQGWRGTARDVDDRVIAEHRLQDERVRYANIIDTAMDAIVMVNDADQIVVFNPAAEKMFGVSANETIGSNMIRFVPEDQRQAYHEGMSAFKQSGYDADIVQSPPQGSRALRADGTEFPCEVTITFSQVDGQHVYTAIIRDITDREHIEDMRHNLINMTAHELRTPLTAIMGHAQLMERTDDPIVLKDSAERIRTEAKHINDLISSLIESDPDKIGKLPVNRILMDLREAVREQVERMTSAYDVHRERITLDLPTGPIMGTWDKLRLDQAIANLIDNALKYSQGEVHVSLTINNDCALIQITDHGIGMTSTEKEQAWTPYYRSKRSQMQEVSGMGLGLFIVKKGIEENGGKVTIDSEVGRGTTFNVCLPLSDEPPVRDTIPVVKVNGVRRE